MADLDWDEMEGLFCQQAPPASTCNSAQGSHRLGNRETQDSATGKRKEPSEVSNNNSSSCTMKVVVLRRTVHFSRSLLPHDVIPDTRFHRLRNVPRFYSAPLTVIIATIIIIMIIKMCDFF